LEAAARFVYVVEKVVSGLHMSVMRQALGLAKRLARSPRPPLQIVLKIYAVLHLRGDEVKDLLVRGISRQRLESRLNEEIYNLQDEFSHDMSGVLLAELIDEAAREASQSFHQSKTRAFEAMRFLQAGLYKRSARGCQRFRGILTSMDHEGTGQISYGATYGIHMQDWALLETPEYLRAVGALEEHGSKGWGPGVLIPNYLTGANSCRDPGPRTTPICCPDECEMDILPKIEAAAGGPYATVRQVWLAVQKFLKSSPTETRKRLREQLSEIASHSKGEIALHSRVLGHWLHGAFPHTCRKPPAKGAPLVIDPAVAPGNWVRAGRHMAMEATEVAEVRGHLQRRWGPDGLGTDPSSFAARSHFGLDAEIQMIRRFHAERQNGGPPVEEALEDALNVRILSRPAILPMVQLSTFSAVAFWCLVFSLALTTWCFSPLPKTFRGAASVPSAAGWTAAAVFAGLTDILASAAERGKRVRMSVSEANAAKKGVGLSDGEDSTEAGETDSEPERQDSGSSSDSETVEVSADGSVSVSETASVGGLRTYSRNVLLMQRTVLVNPSSDTLQMHTAARTSQPLKTSTGVRSQKGSKGSKGCLTSRAPPPKKRDSPGNSGQREGPRADRGANFSLADKMNRVLRQVGIDAAAGSGSKASFAKQDDVPVAASPSLVKQSSVHLGGGTPASPWHGQHPPQPGPDPSATAMDPFAALLASRTLSGP
jgi:hypothetical protein